MIVDVSHAIRDFIASGKDFLHRLQLEGETVGEEELDALSSHLHELSVAVRKLQNVLLFKKREKQNLV